MNEGKQGRVLALSPGRRMVAEIMREGRRVPSLPVAKDLEIQPLVEAREQAGRRFSWLTLFLRAYGLTGEQHPELRRALIRWPYPRLYEHPQTVCAVPVQRVWQGESTLLFPLLFSPENRSLAEISDWLRMMKETDPWQVGGFRKYLRYGRLPWPIRRFGVWHSLHFSGPMRARRFGTCVVSTLGDLSCEQVDVITPLTTYFSFGPIDDQGHVRATIVYDHRVMDGRDAASCLNTVEQILTQRIPEELRAAAGIAAPQDAIGKRPADAA